MADDTDGSASGAPRRRLLARVAVAAAALVLLFVAGRVLGPGATGDDVREGPALHPWELVGCWSLRVASWTVAWREDPAARPDPGQEEASGGAGAAGGRASPANGGDGDVPSSFAAPSRLMLLPDSIDRWGRILPSRRAVPLAGADRPGRSLRWTVHGDTLWLLWSEADTRAGVALRRDGDGLSGRVRTVRGGDSLDATAEASARRLNCSTGATEPAFGREIDRR